MESCSDTQSQENRCRRALGPSIADTISSWLLEPSVLTTAPYIHIMFRKRRGYRRVPRTSYEARASRASQESDTEDHSRYVSQINSSLPLQILIYYNGLLSAAYLVLEGSLIVKKVGILTVTK